MEFEWDDAKAQSNLRDHGVSFSLATRVFGDVRRFERSDDRMDYGEDRWLTVGLISGAEIAVVFTARGDRIRLISARRAEREMNEKSTGKTVRFTLDLDNPPPFTEEEREQVERLKTMQDEDIDFREIPSQAGKGDWTRPRMLGGPVGALRLEAMKRKLLLLDDKVVEFFNQSGEEAPAKMNAVLLEYVEAHRKSA